MGNEAFHLQVLTENYRRQTKVLVITSGTGGVDKTKIVKKLSNRLTSDAGQSGFLIKFLIGSFKVISRRVDKKLDEHLLYAYNQRIRTKNSAGVYRT
jgi:nucleoside-triphosphatase THEP1